MFRHLNYIKPGRASDSGPAKCRSEQFNLIQLDSVGFQLAFALKLGKIWYHVNINCNNVPYLMQNFQLTFRFHPYCSTF
jgi:hypothetical protein